MRMSVFAVYDSATGAFMQPFFAPTKGSAIRSFQDAVNDAKHEFHRHASDYTLFILGVFDDAGGSFETAPPERVASALELLIKDDIIPPRKV